jgi:metalloprotease
MTAFKNFWRTQPVSSVAASLLAAGILAGCVVQRPTSLQEMEKIQTNLNKSVKSLMMSSDLDRTFGRFQQAAITESLAVNMARDVVFYEAAKKITPAESRQLAQQYRPQIDRESKLLPADSAYARRLSALATPLAASSGLALNFGVLDKPGINAFAMDDGTIRLNRGTMELMTDDELVFILGHELGHVKFGHGLAAIREAAGQQAVADRTKSLRGKKLSLASSDPVDVAISRTIAPELGKLISELVVNKYSRVQELECDQFSLQLMQKVGRPTAAARSALLKLADADGKSRNDFMLSHPDPRYRADQVTAK